MSVGGVRWTAQQERDYLARMNGMSKRGLVTAAPEAVTNESELHNEIIAYCKSKGWIYLHGSMAHRTFRTLGEMDFTILADKGRVFFVEAKTAKGKLSTEQLGFAMHAQKLGHEVKLVRSMEDFRKVVE